MGNKDMAQSLFGVSRGSLQWPLIRSRWGLQGLRMDVQLEESWKIIKNTFGKNILTLGWCSVAFFGLCTSSMSSLQPLPSCLGGRGDSWKNLATLRCARSISKEMAGLFVLRLAGQRALVVGMSRWCKQGKPKVEPSSNQQNLQPLHELG